MSKKRSYLEDKLKKAMRKWDGKSVIAFDEKGNKFEKIISFLKGQEEYSKYGYYGTVISFGWPIQYYIRSLLIEFPFKKDMSIDACGKNHKGSDVCISKQDMNDILIQFYGYI